MAKFQLLSCNVALGGDLLNVVARHALIPVTFPEMILLKAVHGENAVTDIYDAGHIERDDDAERARLTETYSDALMTRIFPGARTKLPHGDNRYRKHVTGEVKSRPAPLKSVDAPVPDDATKGLKDVDHSKHDYSEQAMADQDVPDPDDVEPYAPADEEPPPAPDPVTDPEPKPAGKPAGKK